jgi:hypothetical protein
MRCRSAAEAMICMWTIRTLRSSSRRTQTRQFMRADRLSRLQDLCWSVTA